MRQNRGLRKREEIDFIKFMGSINKDDIEIIWSSIVPKLPINCIYISEGRANFALIEKMGKFITEGKFAEIKANPQIICEECQFHSVCEISKNTKGLKNVQ